MVPLLPAGAMNVRVCTSMIVLVTLSLFLRLLAKIQTKAGVLIEDWLILFSASLFYVYNVLFLECKFQ